MSWEEFWKANEECYIENIIQEYKKRKGYKHLLDAIPLGEPGFALEIGAGKANLSKLLRDLGWETVSLDLLPFGAESYVVGDVFALPFREKSFDLVITSGLFEHFQREEVEEIVQEMKRVGDSIATFWPVKGPWWSTFQMIRNMLGAKMPMVDYAHKIDDIGLNPTKAGVVSFLGVLNYIYYYEKLEGWDEDTDL